MAAAPELDSSPAASRLVLVVVPVSVTHSRSMTSRFLPASGPGPDAWRAEGAPLMIVKKILTASTLRPSDRPAQAWLWLLAPVESRPDGSAGLVAVDAPFVGDGTNDVQAVVPGRVDHPLVPGAAIVLDFDPCVLVWVDGGPDGEGPTGKARAAVLGSVGSEFGGAQDHVIRPRAAIKDYAQVSADSTDVLSAAWIGGLGALRECSGCWGVHGSSLRRLVHDLCSLERTLSLSTVQ